MDWKKFREEFAEDAADRAMTSFAPLVLRQVAGLLTDTASRLEAAALTQASDRLRHESPRVTPRLHFDEGSFDPIDQLRVARRGAAPRGPVPASEHASASEGDGSDDDA